LGDVWTIRQDIRNPHPASFPVEIPRRCIETTGAKIVLDPFMGSGTTAIAAEMLGRSWVGFEKAQEYIDQASKRLADWRALPVEERALGRALGVSRRASRRRARPRSASQT
jgi:DNA modification methylase